MCMSRLQILYRTLAGARVLIIYECALSFDLLFGASVSLVVVASRSCALWCWWHHWWQRLTAALRPFNAFLALPGVICPLHDDK